MDVPASVPPPPASPPPAAPLAGALPLCPQCHQPVASEAYFCPNCGKALRAKPLSTSAGTQAWIYALSIFLPMVAYLALSYWPAVKYWRSDDPKAKQIGMVAVALLVISTIVTYWLAIVWIQQYVQQSVNSIGNLGGLGGY